MLQSKEKFSQYQKAEVIILSSNKQTEIVLKANNRLEFCGKQPPLYGVSNLGWKFQNLYIVSDDEIKDGDWFIRLFDNTIIRANVNSDHKHYASKKIISTTDDLVSRSTYPANLPQPSKSFLKKYVETNGEIKDILVEYYLKSNSGLAYNEYILFTPLGNGKGIVNKIHASYQEHYILGKEFEYSDYEVNGVVLKVTNDNKITIREDKEKLYTKNEVISLLKEYRATVIHVDDKAISQLNNFIKENL